MRIMIYRYNSICEPDIIAAFTALGHEVLEMTLEVGNKQMLPVDVVKQVGAFLQEHPVDRVFSVNFFPAVSEVCRIFHIPYLSWTVDCPVLELYTHSVSNAYNQIFLFDKTQYETVKTYHPQGAFYLPLAANPVQKQKAMEQASEKEKEKFRGRISFVGSLYTEKTPYRALDLRGIGEELRGYLEGILTAQELVIGADLLEELITDAQADEIAAQSSNFVPMFSSLHAENHLTNKELLKLFYLGNEVTARYRVHTMERLSARFPVTIYTASDTSGLPRLENRGTVKTLTEMPLVFAESDINLNMTAWSIRSGIAFRVFDVLSCGGFLLTNYQDELPELFTLGQDLCAFQTREELAYLLEYYGNHPEERKEIAAQGLKTLEEKHTFEIRMAEMLEISKRGTVG